MKPNQSHDLMNHSCSLEYFMEETIERCEEEDEEGKQALLESLEEEVDNLKALLKLLKIRTF